MPDFAALFRARHSHRTDFVEDDEADEQADLLRANGLQVLNERVLTSPSVGVLDLIAEHNMAAVLLRRGFTDREYEPRSMQRPVDFVGTCAGRYYRVEVKRLAASEHDELHSNIMTTLNAALESNHEGVVISFYVAESFEPEDINPLILHVKEALRNPRERKTHRFPGEGEWLARYTFRHSTSAKHPRSLHSVMWI